ncbi:hypothetical protein AcV5_003260 [Taiwanofungus camphoratus]|nr:hypothetical protein AcV5_003260 [Antrodia cinnamomea]
MRSSLYIVKHSPVRTLCLLAFGSESHRTQFITSLPTWLRLIYAHHIDLTHRDCRICPTMVPRLAMQYPVRTSVMSELMEEDVLYHYLWVASQAFQANGV